MKKSNTFVLALLFVSLLIFNNCKKGENDPFLSLKSRDARITSTWKLVKSENTTVNTYIFSGTTNTDTYTSTFDGNNMTQSYNGGSSSTSSYSMEFDIQKDGRYTVTIIEDGDTYIDTGFWWWLNDTKKKTRIVFRNDSDSFEVNQLKSKELILKQESYYKETNQNGEIHESTRTVIMTFEKK